MPRPLRALVAVLLAVLLAGGVAITVVGPSSATGGPQGGGGGHDPAAHPGAVRAQIPFVRRRAHPWHSQLPWVARRQPTDATGKVVSRASWRAGSGLPGGSAANPCVKG